MRRIVAAQLTAKQDKATMTKLERHYLTRQYLLERHVCVCELTFFSGAGKTTSSKQRVYLNFSSKGITIV
jgi:hypothetical protein